LGAWKKRDLQFADLRRLPITPEEGFVLSRLDVPLQTAEVAALTGFAPERAQEILTHLAKIGAIEGGAEDRGKEPDLEPEQGQDTPEPGGSGGIPPGDAPSEESPEGADEPDPADDEPPAAEEASYRRLYETKYRGTIVDDRIGAARLAKGRDLMALCLDPDAQVLFTVLENPSCALQHARYAARWHPTTPGLEAIGQRASFIGDPQVQRLLMRNIHLSELMTRRILGGKRMLDAYKASIDTDIPEKTRQFARSVLRAKFGTSQGEERAGIISATEGRVLQALTGLSLDGRATSLLCARTYTSALFVQNLARFGSCPPQLLAHLLRQPIVRRQNQLKTMILQHPNTSAEAKRRL
jgi:hypothetical protein